MSEAVVSETEARFWAKVNKNAERGCWEWKASLVSEFAPRRDGSGQSRLTLSVWRTRKGD